MSIPDEHGLVSMDDALERRLVELETRLAFQEHAMGELGDALAETRLEAARLAERIIGRRLDGRLMHSGLPTGWRTAACS